MANASGPATKGRLLAGEDPLQLEQLDAHPLVREYFGEQPRSQRPGAWQEGNQRLYEHYQALAPERPDALRAMESLFLAVACGCQAGRFRDALHEVYLPRIQRGDAAYSAKVLGARGPCYRCWPISLKRADRVYRCKGALRVKASRPKISSSFSCKRVCTSLPPEDRDTRFPPFLRARRGLVSLAKSSPATVLRVDGTVAILSPH